MKKKLGITTLSLFKQIEALRVLMEISITDVSHMIKVTPLGYKNWKNHEVIPKPQWEPSFRKVIVRLEKRYQKFILQSKNASASQ